MIFRSADTQFFIDGTSVKPSVTTGDGNAEGVAFVTVIRTASVNYKYSFYIDFIDSAGKAVSVNLGKSVAPDDEASNIAGLTFEA